MLPLYMFLSSPPVSQYAAIVFLLLLIWLKKTE